MTRLIGCYLGGEEVQGRQFRRHRFPSRYTEADCELLAAVDEAHGTLSGPATRKVLEREWHDFQNPRFQRLAAISVAHLYKPAPQSNVSSAADQLSADQTHPGFDWGAAGA